MGSNQIDIRFLGDDFNRYYQRCVLFAKSYTYDSAQAECMAAEAMAVLWEKMAAGEQVEFVLPFLFSVIRNKALHYLRRESLKYQIHGSIGSDASREIQFRSKHATRMRFMPRMCKPFCTNHWMRWEGRPAGFSCSAGSRECLTGR